MSVTNGGPGQDAGLRAGDVITEIDGQPTHSQSELSTVLAGLKPGDKVPVTFVRAGGRHTANVTLGSLSS